MHCALHFSRDTSRYVKKRISLDVVLCIVQCNFPTKLDSKHLIAVVYSKAFPICDSWFNGCSSMHVPGDSVAMDHSEGVAVLVH